MFNFITDKKRDNFLLELNKKLIIRIRIDKCLNCNKRCMPVVQESIEAKF